MPIFVFVPSSAAPPPVPNPADLDFFAINPEADTINFATNTEITFGIFALGLSSLDTDTVDVTINGVPAVINGAAQSGYSVSYDVGIYNSQMGLVYKVSKLSSFADYSLVTVAVSYSDLDGESYSDSYSFRVADFSGFLSYAVFGKQPPVVYQDLIITPIGNQQLAEYGRQPDVHSGIVASARESNGTAYLVSDARQQELLEQPTRFPVVLGPTYAAIVKQSAVLTNGDLQTQSEGRRVQSTGQPTRFPTMLSPTFGGRVLNKSIGNLHLQRNDE